MKPTNHISFEIHGLSHLLKRRVESTVARLHMEDTITASNGWILGYLANHPDQDIFQKDIENLMSIRRSTVSKVLRLMESKGLISRVSVPSDARLRKLILTPEGYRVYEAIAHTMDDTEKLLHQDISEEDLATFFKVMEKFKENIQSNQEVS